MELLVSKLLKIWASLIISSSLIIRPRPVIGVTSLATANATEPLVYTRLRHDENFMQVYRAYQHKLPYEDRETAKRLTLIEPDGHNATSKVEYLYYENNKVEASSISYDDLIVQALDRTYKSRLLPVYIYNYDNFEDRLRASDKALVSHARCKRELNYLIDRINFEQDTGKGISPELAGFFDSFAREEPGLLFGNYHWTGVWRQCYKRHIFHVNRSNMSESISFRGRYCIASIRSSNWDEKIKKMTKELVDGGLYFKYPKQHLDYERFFRIQLGLCLPESCDSTTIDWAQAELRQLALHRMRQPFKSYQLQDIFCLPDENSELRQIDLSGRLFILAAVVWCSMIFWATLNDYQTRACNSRCSLPEMKSRDASSKQSKTGNRGATCGGKLKLEAATREGSSKTNLSKFVSAMSLLQNWHRLIETDSLKPPPQPAQVLDIGGKCGQTGAQFQSASHKPKAHDLLFINAFKVISMPIILWGHTGMLGEHLDRFGLDYETLGTNFLFHFHISAVFMVDWFFVITGFITTYIMFVSRRVERNTVTQWIYSLFHRYWRLAPLYLFIFWFCQSVFVYTGSGPNWDYGTSNMTLRNVCRRESFLRPLTLTSNLQPLHGECVMPSWYISNDIQYFMITPLILVALFKAPLIGWLVSMSLIAISTILRAHIYWTDPHANHLELMRVSFDTYMRNNWDFHWTYVEPQYRIGPYLMGVLAGHYAYMVLSGKWSSILYPEGKRSSRNSPPAGKKNGRRSEKFESGSGKSAERLRSYLFMIGLYIVTSMSLATWHITHLFPKALERHVKVFTTIIYTIDHVYVSVGLILLFITIMFGHAPAFKRFLSHPIWTVSSRFNFIVFLIQVELIYWLHQRSERTVDLSPHEGFKQFITLTTLCYATSGLLTLFLELPLMQLEREFVGNWMMRPDRSIQNRVSKAEPIRKARSTVECKQDSELATLNFEQDDEPSEMLNESASKDEKAISPSTKQQLSTESAT